MACLSILGLVIEIMVLLCSLRIRNAVIAKQILELTFLVYMCFLLYFRLPYFCIFVFRKAPPSMRHQFRTDHAVTKGEFQSMIDIGFVLRFEYGKFLQRIERKDGVENFLNTWMLYLSSLTCAIISCWKIEYLNADLFFCCFYWLNIGAYESQLFFSVLPMVLLLAPGPPLPWNLVSIQDAMHRLLCINRSGHTL